MIGEELLSWVRRVPFQAFRLRVGDGKSFEIRHPRMLRVGREDVHIYFFRGEPVDPYERVEMVSLVLIESVEPLEAGHAA